jgi:hypothetical protein
VKKVLTKTLSQDIAETYQILKELKLEIAKINLEIAKAGVNQ